MCTIIVLNVLLLPIKQTPQDFKAEYEGLIKWPQYSELQAGTFAGLAYDAIRAMAVGIHRTAESISDKNDSGCEHFNEEMLPLENFTYSNKKWAVFF